MTRNFTAMKVRWVLLGCLSVLLFGSVYVTAGRQQEDIEVKDPTRKSWEKERGGKPAAKTDKFKIVKPMPKDAGAQSAEISSQIGVTLWRLRPATRSDKVEIKEIRQHGSAKEEWTPERVADDAIFVEGQDARLSIESLRSGFLYVINRTRYKDGTYGTPALIFPTKRIYGGDNRVMAGRTIQIPGPDEEPFTLERGKKGLQESEELVILVMPQPLQSFPVAPEDAQELTEQSVENLIKNYGAPYEISEQEGGVGRAITLEEKQAAKSTDKRLSANDPYPQTVYRLATKPGNPMLVRFEIRVREK